VLLDPLERRMRALAGDERFEEAAEVRDRAAALAEALLRQRRLDGLRRAGRVVLELPGGGAAELDGGRLRRSWRRSGADGADELDLAGPLDGDPSLPLPREAADEVACVAAWLEREAARVRLVSCDGELALPAAALPTYRTRA
jgi:DNA polymerase-3 subunit epsilon